MTSMINIKRSKFNILLFCIIISVSVNCVLFLYLFITSNYFKNMVGIKEEITRLNSPDGIVDGVLIRSNMGGATSDYSFQVYIVPSGEKPKSNNYIFSADHVDSLSLNWERIRCLEIHYKNARISKFSNFWLSKNVQDYRYIVETKLKPVNESSSLRESDRNPIY